MAEKKVNTKRVVDFFGNAFFLKTSDEVCQKHGLLSGQPIIEKTSGKSGVFIGIAPSEDAEEDLWFSLDGDDGKVRRTKPWEEIIPSSDN